MEKNIRDFCALALDNYQNQDQIKKLIEQTAEHIGVYKIGLEQYIRFGKSFLKNIRAHKRNIFLDLKFLDIPNTVSRAVEAAVEQEEIGFLTVHTMGGHAILRAAVDAVKRAGVKTKVIGVTVLTCIDDRTLRDELQIPLAAKAYVKHLAQVAVNAGLDGIVCSASDLPAVKYLLPKQFEVITPGIRLPGGKAHDQKRITTPEDAIAAGSTLLVIGRAVTESANPGKAAYEIIQRIKNHVGNQESSSLHPPG